MFILTILLYVLAAVLFLLAGIGVPSSRYSLIAFGLLAWVSTQILAQF